MARRLVRRWAVHEPLLLGLRGLETPHLAVGVQDQPLALLGKVFVGDLPSQLAIRWPALTNGVVPRSERVIVHAQVGVLSRFLEREEPCENSGVALGGHAAVVVESDVAGYAIGQEPVPSGSEVHLANCS